MSWIAIADHEHNLIDRQELGGGVAQDARDRLLPRGSLLLESRLSPDGRPQTLLAYERTHPWAFSLSLQAVPGGGLALIITQGNDVMHTALTLEAHDRPDILRVTYSWDAPSHWARLTIERPEHDGIVSVELTDPKPLMLEDIRHMASGPRWRRMDPDVIFFAFSDEIEPIGPLPRMSQDVPIQVNSQYRPIGDLRRGDLVDTLESGLVPVLHNLSRIVPARGSFRPVRLRAPYFGLQRDIVVAPDQRLVVGGPEVEYNFGREAVLVPARHLVNGVSAMFAPCRATVRYHQIILPRHESVFAAGSPVESLYIGRIRRKPEQLAASLLASFDRRLLPEHGKSSYPVLRPFEAITLLERRAA